MQRFQTHVSTVVEALVVCAANMVYAYTVWGWLWWCWGDYTTTCMRAVWAYGQKLLCLWLLLNSTAQDSETGSVHLLQANLGVDALLNMTKGHHQPRATKQG